MTGDSLSGAALWRGLWTDKLMNKANSPDRAGSRGFGRHHQSGKNRGANGMGMKAEVGFPTLTSKSTTLGWATRLHSFVAVPHVSKIARRGAPGCF
jgi:hypothetical protein